MVRTLVVTLVFLVSLTIAVPAAAQGGDGSLSGSVKDSQGGALPGVTVTATSPVLFTPSVTVTDASGNYRLTNLPPGTFTVTAELPGFSAHPRQGVLLRAGSNFQVDIVMEVGALAETITVAGETPMLEVSQTRQRADHRCRVPERSARRRREILERLPDADARRDLAAAQRRQRPPELLRQRGRASGCGDADGRLVCRQLQRLQHQSHRPELRSDPGYGGQDRRRRCRLADGLRAGHQHGRARAAATSSAARRSTATSRFPGTRTTSARARPRPGRSTSTTSRSAAPSGATRCGSSERSGTPTTRAAPAARRSCSRLTTRSSPANRWTTTRSRATSRGAR